MSRILFIDDDQLNSKILTSQLEILGFAVTHCADSEKALNLINEKYDLLILDIMMPRIDGVSLLLGIKNTVNKATPIIIYTNLLSEKIKNECLSLGVNEFLIKANITPASFLEIVKKYSKASKTN